MTIKELMAQRWTVRGPRHIPEEGGAGHWEMLVEELPDFFVAAESKEQVADEYLPALQAFLESYVDAGETPALPRHGHWQMSVPRRRPRVGQVLKNESKVETVGDRGMSAV